MGLSVALFPSRWWLIIFYSLAFWLYNERMIYAEVTFLRTKFGNVFLVWANKTPVFISNLSLYRRANLPFLLKKQIRISVRKALNLCSRTINITARCFLFRKINLN